jgi:hypothetical protein
MSRNSLTLAASGLSSQRQRDGPCAKPEDVMHEVAGGPNRVESRIAAALAGGNVVVLA